MKPRDAERVAARPSRVMAASLYKSLLEQFALSAGSELETIHRGRVRFVDRSANVSIVAVVYIGSGEHFTVRKSYCENLDQLIVYVWNADSEPEILTLSVGDALELMGEAPRRTKSWIKQGYYKWSGAGGVPKALRNVMRDRFLNRPEIVQRALQRQAGRKSSSTK